jgi:hypothetical protein
MSPSNTPFGDGSLAALRESLLQLEQVIRTAVRNRKSLDRENFYSKRAWQLLTETRKSFLLVQADHGKARGTIAAHVATVGEDVKAIDLRRSDETLKAIRSALFTIDSDIAAGMQSSTASPSAPAAPYLPPDILPASVYQKLLDLEVNGCFAAGCYNGCAAMLRRLIESLIIEAYEAHGIEAAIKDNNGEYLELKALIGKAVNEPKLRLGRNTRAALPNLKFLGDLSAHSRRHFIRLGDLEKYRNDARVAIEELGHHYKH